MSKYKEVTLSDISINLDNLRIPLSAKERRSHKKIYPYYGAQNIIDYVEDYIFDGEYVLIAEDGENLKSQNAKVANIVSGKFWVNNHAHIIQAKNNNNLRYIYYLLNLVNFRPYITGSAQPKLTKDNLEKIVLRIHFEKEQNKIVSILSSLDKKIELNNQINQKLEAMAKTLYDYWFVQFDFPFDFAQGKPDADGKPYKSSGGKMVYNEELKREIPAGWEIKELKHITEVSNESLNPMLEPDKDFKHYSIPVFDDTKTYAIEKGKTIKSNKFIIKENDILVSKLNPKFNRIVYPIDEENLISSTEFVIWRAENKVTKNYLYILAKHEHFISFCIQSASGTSNSHKRVNPTVMMDYKVVFNKDVSNVFGMKVHPILNQIIKKQKQNQKLIKLRDWLLPMLMNGQVKVADAQEQVDELMVAEPEQAYGESYRELIKV